MITDFIEWTTHLNETNRLAFALVAVGVMAAVGIVIAFIAELVFKVLGIKTEKMGHHH
jgi:small neutral amino acid transporter SnatA (MarC family)